MTTWGMLDNEIVTIWKSLMSPKLRELMHRPSPGLGRIGVPVEPFGIGCFGKLVTEVKSCKKLDADFEFIDYDCIKNAVAGKSYSLAVAHMNSVMHFDDHSHFVIDYKTDVEKHEHKLGHLALDQFGR